MTGTQLFAFVILPLVVAAGGKIIERVHRRNFDRRHPRHVVHAAE